MYTLLWYYARMCTLLYYTPWDTPVYTPSMPVHAASYDATLGATFRSPGLNPENN